MFTKEDNEVLDRILEARKTCRAFSDEMPTDDEIKEVIQAGCVAQEGQNGRVLRI